jgi:hypothetical protein
MAQWMRVVVVLVLMAGAAGAGVAIGGATQEPEPPKVLVANKPNQAVPVDATVSLIRQPVILDGRTTVALRPGTTVALEQGTTIRVEAPIWEYRELRVPTDAGNIAAVMPHLTAAGAQGWETTGLQFASAGTTVLILKRQRGR